MLANLAAVMTNHPQAGIRRFVLARFVRDASDLQNIRDAAGLPLRVAQLVIPLADIEHRLASDVTTGAVMTCARPPGRSRPARARTWLTSWSGTTAPSASRPST
jgi:hypothetical protein